MGGPAYQLVQADCGKGIPLADNSVHTCITSPPYWQLRSYQGVEPTNWPSIIFRPLPEMEPVEVPVMRCCLGLEDTLMAYVAHLVHVARDLKRVLHKSATFWCNLGDGYNSYNGNRGASTSFQSSSEVALPDLPGGYGLTAKGLGSKQLLMVPARVALAFQADGWILRSAPPWVKPGNAMPESCQDRPTTAHESLFMFTKSPDYYFDMESVRRGVAPSTVERDRYTRITVKAGTVDDPYACQHDHETICNPSGRSLRTADVFLDSLDDLIAYHADRASELRQARDRGGLVASDADDPAAVLVNPEAFRGSHYAVMPRRLAEILVRCSTSERGVCQCGAPWERVVELGEKVASGPNKLAHKPRSGSGSNHLCRQDAPPDEYGDLPRYQRTFLGWRPTCSCPPGPTRPAVVLDPFVGSGTTLVAANALERDALGLDASADYLRMAARRLDRPHARPLAEPADDGPGPLFSGGES
jgi:hypothetical protein